MGSVQRLDSRRILSRIRSVGVVLLFLACTVSGGCRNVDFYEREAFADRLMEFEPDPIETHFFQKSYYSREGGVGGFGTAAGGGCGCY